MFFLSVRSVLVAGLSLLFATPVFAQHTIGEITHLEGSVTLVRRAAPGAARLGAPLIAGDELHTGLGRAEITIGSGTVMVLDAHTRVVLHWVDRVQLIDGRVFVERSGSGPFVAVTGGGQVHVAPMSAVEITTTAANRDLMVNVIDGDARIVSPWGSEAVTASQTAFVSGPTGRPFVTPFVGAPADQFYQYAGTRFEFLSPPPTFLPYAHPVYRQQQYLRLLRKARHDRPGDRPGDKRDGDRRHDGNGASDRPQVNPLADRVMRRQAASPPAKSSRQSEGSGTTRPEREAAATEKAPGGDTRAREESAAPPAKAAPAPAKAAAPPARAAKPASTAPGPVRKP